MIGKTEISRDRCFYPDTFEVNAVDGYGESISQPGFETLSSLVQEHFQVDEALIEYGVATFYLKQPQETKQPFIRLLDRLDEMGMVAFLRRINGKLVLKVFPKPPHKPSNTLINWLLLLATVATTFITGFIMASNLASIGGSIDPIIGGISFTMAIMAIFGMHEMGHKLTANKNRIEATAPYFIPGPPLPIWIGTFGAVIIQKSLPRNRDALFDIGVSGPIIGFAAATIVSIIGSIISVPALPTEEAAYLPAPPIIVLITSALHNLGVAPSPPPGYVLYMHPIELAGWVGMLVTAINLLPAATLDGGHIARAMFGDRARSILAAISLLLLAITGFWLMAFFVLFLSFQKHPGALDDVSEISKGRKIMALMLCVVFILSFPFLS